MVDAMFGACFTENDAVLDIKVQHFEDLHGVFAYHTLLCNGVITVVHSASGE